MPYFGLEVTYKPVNPLQLVPVPLESSYSPAENFSGTMLLLFWKFNSPTKVFTSFFFLVIVKNELQTFWGS